MSCDVMLREVTQDDVPVFFEQQRDPVAIRMVYGREADPPEEAAFRAKWDRILRDETAAKRTVLFGGQVAGNVLSFLAPWSGHREVGYWIGREFWGRGVATGALAAFLRQLKVRPLHARVARGNVASLRVLLKCGFTVAGDETDAAEGVAWVLLTLGEENGPP
jgi:RimJ/RimL family protein N-acetyltransferase